MKNSPARGRWHKSLWILIPLTLAVLFAAFLVEERVRGERALAQWKREMTAKGERLTWKELLRPDVVFDPDAQREFFAAATSWSSAGRTVTDDAPAPIQYFQPGFCTTTLDQDSWTNDAASNVTWANYEQALQPFTNSWTEANQIVLTKSVRSKLDFSQGFTLLLPNLSKMKGYAQMASRMALLDLKMGRSERALETLRAVFSGIDQQRDEPLLITELVRIAELAIIYRSIWAGVETDRFSAEQLAVIQSELARMDLLRDMANGLRMERALVGQEIRKLREGRTDLGALLDMTYGNVGNNGGFTLAASSSGEMVQIIVQEFLNRLQASSAKYVHGPVWRYAWLSHDELEYLRVLQDFIDRSGIAGGITNPTGENQYDPLGLLAPSGGRYQGFYNRLRYRLTPAIVPSLSKSGLKAARMQAQINLAIAACALHRYRYDKHDYPEQLAELVPAWLPAVPVDPLDGRPLRYRRQSADRFTLYSVGEDQKDDGGNGNLLRQPAKGGTPNPFNTVDLLWPMRTNVGGINN